MSRNEWESGELKIPSAEWVGLRKKLIAAWNGMLEKQFTASQELYQHLVTVAKGKRGFNFAKEAQDWIQARSRSRRSMRLSSQDDEIDERLLDLAHIVLPYTKPDERPRPKAPKKKEFPFAKQSAREFGSTRQSYWDGHIELKDEGRMLIWRTDNNNRAVERAWAHPMGSALSSALGSIKFTRGTGGVFVGNDEYSRDDRNAGGGSNYVTQRFGPLGESDHPFAKLLRF